MKKLLLYMKPRIVLDFIFGATQRLLQNSYLVQRIAEKHLRENGHTFVEELVIFRSSHDLLEAQVVHQLAILGGNHSVPVHSLRPATNSAPEVEAREKKRQVEPIGQKEATMKKINSSAVTVSTKGDDKYGKVRTGLHDNHTALRTGRKEA